MIQIILSCVPLIVFIVAIKVLKIKYNNYLNIGLLSFLAILLTMYIFNPLISAMFPILKNALAVGGIVAFFYYFFHAGVVEEVSKFISLKISRPKTKSELLLNLILIGTLFGVIENYAYLSMDISAKSILCRCFDMHILFASLMGYLLVTFEEKNKKMIGMVVALLVTICLHGTWDFANGSIVDFLIGGILCYTAMVFVLKKTKKYQETENVVATPVVETPPVESVGTEPVEGQVEAPVANEVVQEPVVEAPKAKQKDKYFIPKIAGLVILTLLWLIAYSNHDSRTKVGQVCQYNSLEMKVIEAENKTTSDNKKYIRVKVNVKNNSSNQVVLESVLFKLVRLDNGESTMDSLSVALEDEGKILDYEINPNGEVEGYVYFEVDGNISEYKLTYSDFDGKNKCNMNIS